MQILKLQEIQPQWNWRVRGYVSTNYPKFANRKAVIKTEEAGALIAKKQGRFNGNYTVGQLFAIVDERSVSLVRVESITLGWADNPARSYHSIKELKKELGFTKKIDIEDELPHKYGVHVNFRVLDETGIWGAYLYDGRWSLGGGATGFSVVELESFDAEKVDAEKEEEERNELRRDLKLKQQNYKRQVQYYQKLVQEVETELANL